MKYWFTINEAIPDDEARKVWFRISHLKTNMTVLLDRTYIYGNGDMNAITCIANELSSSGFSFERG